MTQATSTPFWAALPAGARIAAIAITHAHLDHSAGGPPVWPAPRGATVYAFGDAAAGRSEVMTRLANDGLTAGGEGVDTAFAPDALLADGDVLRVGDVALRAVHTPGHMGNHLSFIWGATCFTGDLVMGWSSSLISPPDGDARAYRDSCTTLLSLTRSRGLMRLLPAHGAPVTDPVARIEALLAHRTEREAQILEQLTLGPCDLNALTRAIYTDLPAQALPYAARNTLAHLIDLTEQKRVSAAPHLNETALFSIAGPCAQTF